MPFTPKNWQDAPSTATPISAVALEDVEERVTDYTDTRVDPVEAGKITALVSEEAPINPEHPEWGAVGNGTTDDSSAFSDILAAIGTAGADIMLPHRRNFLIANLSLTGKDNITFKGPGQFKRKPLGSSPDNNNFITFYDCTGIRFEGVRFDSNNVERFGGLSFRDCAELWIDGCHFFDSNLNATWASFDHFALIFNRDSPADPGCSDLWVTNNLFEDGQVELDNVTRFHVKGNTSKRAAGTAAIGHFTVGDSEHCTDGEITDNIILDPRKAGIKLQNEAGGLSSNVWRNVVIGRNIVKHETATAGADGVPIGVGQFTGATTGTGNVRHNIRVVDNVIWTDAAALAARTVPAIWFLDPAATQDFDYCEVSRNRVTWEISGDWAMDLRDLTNSDVVGNAVNGTVTHGLILVDPSGCRVTDNRALASTAEFSLNNPLGGNVVSLNYEDGAPPTLWNPTGHANDIINP